MRSVVGIVFVAFLAGCIARASDPPTALSGCWTIERTLSTTNVAGLAQADVDLVIGTHLVYERSCMKSGSSIRFSPRFVATPLSDRDFAQRMYRIPLRQLGIDDPTTTMIEVSSATLRGKALLGDKVFLGGRQPIVEYEGVFFALKRADVADVKCACPAPRQP